MNQDEESRLELREVSAKGNHGLSWQAWLVLLIVIGVLIFIIAPPILGRRRVNSDKDKALGHAKQVLLAFVEFEGEYGTRPGRSHTDERLIPGAKADTSNACFRQFFQGLDTVRSEVIFYAPSKFTVYPDNIIGDKSNHFAEACAKGEVGFLYIDAPTARDGAPLFAAPLDDHEGRFDPESYNGKAVVMKTDGSVEAFDIDPYSKRIYTIVDDRR